MKLVEKNNFLLQIYIDDENIPPASRSIFIKKQIVFPRIGELVDLDRHPRVHTVTHVRLVYEKDRLRSVVITAKPRI